MQILGRRSEGASGYETAPAPASQNQATTQQAQASAGSIDDPLILTEIEAALQTLGYAGG